MEKQIEKFTKLCSVFDIMVFDEDPDYVRAVKGKCELKVGKFLLGNDYQIINTLKDVYALFRKQELKR